MTHSQGHLVKFARGTRLNPLCYQKSEGLTAEFLDVAVGAGII